MSIVNISADESGDIAVTPAVPEQPDGIEYDTRDLPDPKRAAERVNEYIAANGDGMYDLIDGHPLYARDLFALTKAADRLAEQTKQEPTPTADAYRATCEALERHRKQEAEQAAEIERLRAVAEAANNDGYIRGLQTAAGWAAAFNQDLPGLDRPTCVQFAKGLTAMVESAQERLGKDEYLIWSHHHKTWWGPNASGYRSHIADAGRYALDATNQHLSRGCYCCLVPEVVIPAPPAGLHGAALAEYGRKQIREATDAAIDEDRINRCVQCGEVGTRFDDDSEPIHTEPCQLTFDHGGPHDWAQREAEAAQ